MANVYEMSTQSKVASRVKNIFRLLRYTFCKFVHIVASLYLRSEIFFTFLFSTSSFLMQNCNDTFYPSAVHSLVVLRIVVYVFML